MTDQVHKSHHKSKHSNRVPSRNDSKNPKANTFANPGRHQRQAARTHDLKEKRLHVPLVDRLPEEAPPLVVGVVGPPRVGKTTLIKSLIRRYTKQTLSNPAGPLTVVTSKRRRLTFIECPSDSLAGMIDVAKIVDIVLLLIDGKYGFEMETMEFLNVLSASGMPGNVFGVLTKLDLFKKQDALRAQKKRLKHRFWSELYQGAKLFFLSGVVNGRYPDREILNLSRFLSVMKNPRPLVWRNSHPYCLADRFLDATPPTEIENDPKCDRTISLYGYLRGTNFPAQHAKVHVPGVGDLDVADIEALPDPCPTPYRKQAEEKVTGKTSRKRLGEKQKVLFAPMSDVGGVLVDRDAVYVDVKTSTFDDNADADHMRRGLGEQLVIGLHGNRKTSTTHSSEVRLFGNASAPFNEQVVDDDTVSDPDGSSTDIDGMRAAHDSKVRRETALNRRGSVDSGPPDDVAFMDSDSSDDDLASSSDLLAKINAVSSREFQSNQLNSTFDVDNNDGNDDEARSETNLHLAATFDDFKETTVHSRVASLSKMIYDLSMAPRNVVERWQGKQNLERSLTENPGSDEDDFFRVKNIQPMGEREDERMIPVYDYSNLEAKWSTSENIGGLRRRLTSSRNQQNFENGSGPADHSDEDFSGSSDDEGDGEFEDLEAREGVEALNVQPPGDETLDAERERNAKKKEELQLRFEEEDREGFLNPSAKKNAANSDAEFGEDEWYEAQKAKLQKQLDINRGEFEELDEASRVRVEGYRAGTYARITLSRVPFEFAANFNPRYPLIIGGLNPTENRFGFVQVRIKRHRWHQKILKTNDPLIFSLGWRRFQTVPVYSLSDSRTRNRLLKYTPEHMHCFGTFYGPLSAPNTGFCCVQSLSTDNSGFRIAASGVVLNVDESVDIVKKLKLKGYPHKVYKNTAIVKDMFGSDLEVARFKSGTLKTVSGIRGMIKGRAGHQYPEGYVRAGFEDKILMSDVLFLSTWRLIRPREFYLPVTNLLTGQASDLKPSADGDSSYVGDDKDDHTWKGMRLTGQVRHALDLPTPFNPDSSYHQIDRPSRHFNPLQVPRKLQAQLPFKSQMARMKPQKRPTYLQRRAVVLGGEEKKARDLMQKVMTIRNEKAAKRAAAQEKRKEPYRRRVAEDLEKKTAREKKEKEEYWKREGKKQRKRAADGDIGGGGHSKKIK